jgi:hypothetical protein
MTEIIANFNTHNPEPLYRVEGENHLMPTLGERARIVDGAITLILFDGSIHNIKVSETSYYVPDNITGIDAEGVFTKLPEAAAEARMFRPFVDIFSSAKGERHIRQWEYDRYCWENSRPDSPYHNEYKKCRGNIKVWEHILQILERSHL